MGDRRGRAVTVHDAAGRKTTSSKGGLESELELALGLHLPRSPTADPAIPIDAFFALTPSEWNLALARFRTDSYFAIACMTARTAGGNT